MVFIWNCNVCKQNVRVLEKPKKFVRHCNISHRIADIKIIHEGFSFKKGDEIGTKQTERTDSGFNNGRRIITVKTKSQ